MQICFDIDQNLTHLKLILLKSITAHALDTHCTRLYYSLPLDMPWWCTLPQHIPVGCFTVICVGLVKCSLLWEVPAELAPLCPWLSLCLCVLSYLCITAQVPSFRLVELYEDGVSLHEKVCSLSISCILTLDAMLIFKEYALQVWYDRYSEFVCS